MSGPTGSLVEEVGQFLYREARLLDERRWDEWLDLWAEGARYGVPTRHAPHLPDRTAVATPTDTAGPGELWWVDEDKAMLARRITKLQTAKAWAENPPSRTRRLVTNVEVLAEDGDRVEVTSNFLLYRNRRTDDVELFVGCHRDVLERGQAGLRIRERLVVLDATVLPGSDLAVFL